MTTTLLVITSLFAADRADNPQRLLDEAIVAAQHHDVALAKKKLEACLAVDHAHGPCLEKLVAVLAEAAAPVPAPAVEKLLQETSDASDKKDDPRARLKLEACLAADPNQLSCIMKLAITYARLGASDNDPLLTEKARDMYRRYLKVAPPDDPYVAKIQTILNTGQ